ncbi:MAG: ABC transporter ATP-binding protein [Shewanella xiamenensis]|jgi:putative ABC transport system ATP-binding protein|uniref:ABC transporter ATP-binding protein n=1 Tax=Shewanella xiamenensis TaxID=332186 RepID=UPI001C500897|nr:ABC transporter ATP-binding protein [Shewanella xiamenensis]MBW0281215.1 phosphonate ABC transporter ATP-binding protein [Shewanella xiamenensis]MCD8551932.1 ABC transporter ATP-binding protein [Shewanella xiamenensis]MCD8561355.1 ABC transporter ATP-binding protein [Shewanella xiamenensis]
MNNLLELKNINKSYQTKTLNTLALNDISLAVKEGDFISICGPSGGGKSTLLSILGMLDEFDSGSYVSKQSNLGELSRKEKANLRSSFFGLIFQSFHLIDELTVLENVLLPLRYAKNVRKDAEEDAKQWLRKFNLDSRINHYPNQLSGGQQQRVAIARALIANPKVLLVDEATGNLDSENSEIVMTLLKQLNEEGLTIIMVTHDEHCAAYSKTRYTMKDGCLLN